MPDLKQVGPILRKARETAELTHAEIYTKTRILPELQEAMERGDFGRLGVAFYQQSFLKQYAEALGLHGDKILALYRREQGYKEAPNKQQLRPLSRMEKWQLLLRTPQTRLLGAGALVLVLAIIVLWQLQLALRAPGLELEAPLALSGEYAGSLRVATNSIRFSGETDPGAAITLNAQNLRVESDGSFDSGEIPLSSGVADWVIAATSTLGQKTQIALKIEKVTAVTKLEKLNAIVSIKNDQTEFKIIADGETKFEGKAFAGDALNAVAAQTLTITTEHPANLSVRIGEQDFALQKSTTTWQLIDGQIVEQ